MKKIYQSNQDYLQNIRKNKRKSKSKYKEKIQKLNIIYMQKNKVSINTKNKQLFTKNTKNDQSFKLKITHELQKMQNRKKYSKNFITLNNSIGISDSNSKLDITNNISETIVKSLRKSIKNEKDNKQKSQKSFKNIENLKNFKSIKNSKNLKYQKITNKKIPSIELLGISFVKKNNKSNKQQKSIQNINLSTFHHQHQSFIFDSTDEEIRRLLITNKWNQCNKKAVNYTLKWNYKEEIHQYDKIKYNNNPLNKMPMMYYNHLRNNYLCTKYGLHQIYLQLFQSNQQPNKFIPQTYRLPNQCKAFMRAYKQNCIISLLKKYKLWINLDIKAPNLCMNQIDIMTVLKQKKFYGSIQLKMNLISMIYLLIHCQTIKNQKQGENNDLQIKYKSMLQNQEIITQFYLCNQGTKSFKDLKFDSNLANKLLGIIISNKQQSPSNNLLQILNNLYEYFCNNNNKYYHLNIDNNLWIIKPDNGSCGQHIQIINNYQKLIEIISSSKIQNYIIQKYIQHPFIINQHVANISQFATSVLWKKKFDIRQWVLIKPPNLYLFSAFYLKICSKQYQLTNVKDLRSHLSNYSVNKESYNAQKDQQSSVLSENEFKKLLLQIGYTQEYVQSLKNTIKIRIRQIGVHCMQQIDKIEGCFELIGFDIILDQSLNPWIIEGNMSPACEQRTPWLKKMKNALAYRTLRIVLSKKETIELNNQLEKQYDAFYWQKIAQIPMNQKNKICHDSLQIQGKSIKLGMINSMQQE